MTKTRSTRRHFLHATGAGLAGGLLTPYVFTADAEERALPKSKNDRFRIGAIGMRYQGSVVTEKAMSEGDVVAICDVDR
jgi:myo-inositol 2-dehydrogenase/D-chiro-inositol 1-dehydrogenase